ncbi:MAG TPA: hypothetical protein DF698_05965 [Candidatus Atribacteria bacterium]|nr:hypothetical protein [Candidatus Atribacteria bacterium]
MSWKIELLGNLLLESRIPAINPNPDKRIRVKLNVAGVEKRPLENEVEGATKQFIRKAGQFIYGKQNFHKGAFGIIPPELDGYETSADIPSFDVREDCLPEWIFYFFKINSNYIDLEKIARGMGSKRIHPDQLASIQIPLPSIDDQRVFIDRFRKIETSISEIESENNIQFKLINKFRQQVLQDAVQGKLVQQDPDDEPASVLLERIKAEKEKLVQEKKIKKEKPLPPIKPEETPFEIPENWGWCRLGELSCVVRGGSPRPAGDKRYYEGAIPFLKVADLTADENIYLNSFTYTIKEAGLHKTRYVDSNTLMLTNSGATLGIPKICMFPTTFNDGIAAFLGIDNMDKEFLYYFLKSKTGWYLKEASKGQGQPNLNTDIISMTPFALPPLPEQHRIVIKIKQLLKFCYELEQTIKQNQKYTLELLQVALKEALEPNPN